MLLHKVTLQYATRSSRKRHELVYQMLNKLDSTILVHHVSCSTHSDAFMRSPIAFEIPKIADWFGDG